MHDENKPDDEFEDLDFDDIEDFDDFDDASDLDVIDEFEDAEETGAPIAQEDALDAEDLDFNDFPGDDQIPAGAAPKSFLDKNFKPLLFGGVALVALIVGGSLFLNSTPKPPRATMPAPDLASDETGAIQDDMPPMPAPMDSAEVAPADDGVLTPMPSFEGSEETSAELPGDMAQDLALDAELDTAAPLEGDVAILDAPPEMADPALDAPAAEPLAETPLEETALSATSEDTILMPEERLLAEDEEIIDPIDTPAEVLAETPALTSDEAPNEAAEESLDLALIEETPVQPPAPIEDEPSDVSAQAEMDEIVQTSDLTAQELEAASTKNQALEAELSDAKEEIQTLNSDIEALKAQITALEAEKAALADKAQSAKTQESAPTKAPVAAVPSPKPAPKPTSTKPAPSEAVTSAQWVLRSAQPGQAVISPKNGQDMLRISVGDTVPGLGQIQSISTNAQGKWVVQGTNGQISQ